MFILVARINVLDNGSLFYHNGTKHDEIVFRVKFNKIYKVINKWKRFFRLQTLSSDNLGMRCVEDSEPYQYDNNPSIWNVLWSCRSASSRARLPHRW